ncbi:MAG TPA: cysteine--tRNA ligase, partial [Actinocrinis sp.]
MPIRLHDTATRSVRDFVPREPGKVSIYLCGATVQAAPHIGHIRSGVSFDILSRWLAYRGLEVTLVRNITDIDDKILRKAAEQGVEYWRIAQANERAFTAGYDALGCFPPAVEPRATGHVPEMVELMQDLIDDGHAYAADSDVYFDVRSYPAYGALSNQRLDDMQSADDADPKSAKRDPRDFTLWKGAKPGEPAWPTPWGSGRPGWHLECSAMARRYLGREFDIHGGGLDLVFPHHENEVVQSESFSGKPFATYWLHNGLLTKSGKKISKSDPGTVILMGDLLQKHDPDTLRCLFLASHYRRPIDYGPGRLDELARGLQAFHSLFDRFGRLTGESYYSLEAPTHKEDSRAGSPIPEVGEHRDRFLEAMDDDFNTGGALGELFEIAHALNRYAHQPGLEPAHARAGQV